MPAHDCSPRCFIRAASHEHWQLTPPSLLTPEMTELLRARLSILARLTLGISLVGLGMELLDRLLAHPVGDSTYLLLFGPILLLPALLWAVSRRPLPPRLLYGAEWLALLGTCTAYAVMCRYTNLFALPRILSTTALPLVGPVFQASAILMQYVMLGCMLLGATQVAVARAALVPSTVRHSLVLTCALGLPVVLVTWAGLVPFVEADAALRAVLTPADRGALAIMAAIWWAFTVATCGVITSVMHRLRAEVSQARQLGQYTLEEKLGEGGMGVVYRARHAMMRRPTAVKLLPPERAGADAIARFEREVQLTAQLTHPNTITLFDYGRTSEGVFYYAMELLDGLNLEQVVEGDGPQPPARVIHVLRMVAGALAEAHALGLIHRDIKPANVFLCTRGGEPDVAKVLDFGLVKTLQAGAPGITQQGALTGTPLYMSPEAIATPEEVDARGDLYSVGAVGYFLLTGTHLFTARTSMEACAHQLHTPPERPSARLKAPVPADLEALLLACLEKDPARRPQTAEELGARLAACADAGAWSAAQARAWWAGRAGLAKAGSETPGLENGPTLVSERPAVGDGARPPTKRVIG